MCLSVSCFYSFYSFYYIVLPKCSLSTVHTDTHTFPQVCMQKGHVGWWLLSYKDRKGTVTPTVQKQALSISREQRGSFTPTTQCLAFVVQVSPAFPFKNTSLLRQRRRRHWLYKGSTRSAEFGLTGMDTEEMDGAAGEYFVQREVLDELRLDEVAQKGTWSTKPTLRERVKESLR